MAKCRISTELGEIIVDTDVIAKYAGTIAVECIGIVGMATKNVKDGLVNLLRKENLSNGINVTVEDNRLGESLHGNFRKVLNLLHRRQNRQRHSRSGIAVRHWEYIQVIDPFFIQFQILRACQEHLAQQSGINCII